MSSCREQLAWIASTGKLDFVGWNGVLLGLGCRHAYYVSAGVGECGETGELTVPTSFGRRVGVVECWLLILQQSRL